MFGRNKRSIFIVLILAILTLVIAVTHKKFLPFLKTNTETIYKTIMLTSEKKTEPAVEQQSKTDAKPAAKTSTPAAKPLAPKVIAPPRDIKVKNNITDKQLGYKHFFGTFTPTTFTITVNGKEIARNDSETIRIQDNKLQVVYSYEFMNGKRKGAKIIKFEVDPKTNALDLTFKWKDDWRIIINGTTPISATEIPLEEKNKTAKNKN